MPFALWYITRTPGGVVSAQPGQQQRDAGLTAWLFESANTFNQMTTKDYWDHMPNSSFVTLPGTFLK